MAKYNAGCSPAQAPLPLPPLLRHAQASAPTEAFGLCPASVIHLISVAILVRAFLFERSFGVTLVTACRNP